LAAPVTYALERTCPTLNTKKLYTVDHEHIDGSDLPIVTKPTWTLQHFNADGSPSQAIGVFETSPDGCSARFTAEHLGTVEVTISAVASPTAVASKTFRINILPHPIATRSATLKVTQSRNGSIHH
jgi:hypothetical protein